MVELLLIVPVLLAAGLLAHEFRRSARFAVVAWWGMMCLVPYWLEIRLVFEWPPQALLGIVLIPAMVEYARETQLRLADFAALAFLAMLLAAVLAGQASKAAAEQVIVQGGLGYAVARTLVVPAGKQWFGQLLCGTAALLALWGAIEFFLGVHIFQHLAVGPEASWAAVQVRGDHVRSDAALGDPIVLAAFLAYCVPYIVAGRYSAFTKLLLLLTVGLGIYTTDSRAGFIAAVLGLVIVVAFARSIPSSARARLAVLCVCIAVPVYLTSGLLFTQSNAAGQTQLNESTTYRVSLYSDFLKDIQPLGLAHNVVVNKVTGDARWRNFGSIDSTLIYLSLDFGWLPVLVGAVGLAGLLGRVLVGRASIAQLALAAQIPIFLTVAPITQYRTLIFFSLGLGVAWLSDAEPVDARRWASEAPAVRTLRVEPA